MARGKRYDTERKLNYQKVFAVIIAIAVIIMFIFIIRNILKERKEETKEYEYFALYAQNKWGIINQEGTEVIQPAYEEMIIVPDKTKDVFLCVYNVNEETGEYKTKAINSKNEEILTGYEQIEILENIDNNDNVWYEENILRVKKNGKYGLIDLNGKEILPIQYDEITLLKGLENSILIRENEKIGLANDKGTILIDVEYKEIKPLGETYKEGYITIDENGKSGVISATKKQILENKYEEILPIYLEEYYLVKENGKQKLINSNSETIIEKGFDEIKSVTTNGVIFLANSLYGEMKTSGEITIEAKYQYLQEVQDGIYIAKQNNQYGIIDNVGNEKIPFSYTNITYDKKSKLFFAEDSEYNTSIIDEQYNIKTKGIISEINRDLEYIRIRVEDDYKYYNFKGEENSNIEVLTNNTLFLSKKDGKYGYVDKKGNAVTEYIYDDATEQNEYGFAAVKKNGVWGSIDKEGKEVIEPKYNLENNLKIDFIGKWHLGEDLNMNYYCEK